MYNYPIYRDTENKLNERERKLKELDPNRSSHPSVLVSLITIFVILLLLIIVGFVFYYVAGR